MATETESKIPANDELFEDSFDFLEGTSLADLYLEELRRLSERHYDGIVTRPYPIWRARGEVLALEYGISITPEAYHPAIDLTQETPQQITETAHSHYERLRELGMPVVGHLFEPINESQGDFELHPQYPTILVGTKYPTNRRPNDKPENDEQGAGSKFVYDLDRAVELGFDVEEAEEKLLSPVRAYLQWCKESDQPYMHTGLGDFVPDTDFVSLSAYLYHARQQVLGIGKLTTKMEPTSYEGNWVPVGHLSREAEKFTRLAKHLTGREENLDIPLL
jgi:hypothetical protein